MGTERELDQERGQIVEAIDWIDAERKRLSRFCFSETREKWHGDKGRGRKIALMKKEGEWLYRRRCLLRNRISLVNKALKDARMARSGTVGESFGSTFVDVARELLPAEQFDSIVDEATRRCAKGDDGVVAAETPAAETPAAETPAVETSADTVAVTVLDELKTALAAFKESNAETPVAEAPPEVKAHVQDDVQDDVQNDTQAEMQDESSGDTRETQSEFGLVKSADDDRDLRGVGIVRSAGQRGRGATGPSARPGRGRAGVRGPDRFRGTR